MLTRYNAVLVPARYLKGTLFTNVLCASTKIASSSFLQDAYYLINCELVQCLQVNINGKQFDLWCDEEGKLSSKPANIKVEQYDDIIVGNILITKGGDELESLTEEDITDIQQWVYNARLALYNE